MEESYTSSEFECTVCMTLPIEIYNTSCCGLILCQKCKPQIEKCPQRCSENEKGKFEMTPNKVIQKLLNRIKATCSKCQTEFERTEILAHEEDCDPDAENAVVLIPDLHPCCLYKQSKDGSWLCEGRHLIEIGCALSGFIRSEQTSGVAWTCSRCEISFCHSCVELYSLITDPAMFKKLPKKVKHLTHYHPLEAGRFNGQSEEYGQCIGSQSHVECTNDLDEDPRCMHCSECKIFLCVKCFKLDPKDFLLKDKTSLHKHMLHFHSVGGTTNWRCDIQKEGCIKKTLEENQAKKTSYRCEMCNFDVCSNCL